jgi:hypothetical protein
MGLGVVAVCVVLGVALIVVGGNILVNVAGQVAHAFDQAMAQAASQGPATAPPSGVALDTPVLATPDNGGYTNQATLALSGTVPGNVVGKTGYRVRIYAVKNGSNTQLAEVPVGATTHFTTGALTLAEGPNAYAAALVTPTGVGQLSPTVTYILDTKAPALSIATPVDGSTQSGSSVVVSGKTDPGVTVTIRNKQVTGGGLSSKVVGQDGRFAITVGLVAGSNSIAVTATDQAGNVSTGNVTVKRSFGNISAHLSVAPATFRGKGPTLIKLTARATSSNGGPLAGAQAVIVMQVYGLPPITSPLLTTDQTGTARWQTVITGATVGPGTASLMVTTADGDHATTSVRISTT